MKNQPDGNRADLNNFRDRTFRQFVLYHSIVSLNCTDYVDSTRGLELDCEANAASVYCQDP
jgi:hypothetical protein